MWKTNEVKLNEAMKIIEDKVSDISTLKLQLKHKDEYIAKIEKDRENMILELTQTNSAMEEIERDHEEIEHELISKRKDNIFKDGIITGFERALSIFAWQIE